MNSPIPNDRETEADKIGYGLYKHNWDKIKAALTKLDPTFAKFVIEIPYGSVYPRKGLSLKEKELVAITSLTCLGLKPQLKSHLIAAINQGYRYDQLSELFLHLAMFIGFPLAMDGLKVLKEIKDERTK